MPKQPTLAATYREALCTIERILRDLRLIQRHTTEAELLRELQHTRDACAEAVLVLDERLNPKTPRD